LRLPGNMKAAVFYATLEGQTRTVASRIAGQLRHHGIETDLIEVKTAATVEWTAYSAACVAASVHVGRHEPEMTAFVRRYRAELARVGAAFVSVMPREAGAEEPVTSEADRRAADDVQRIIALFVTVAGFRPGSTPAS
jgi:menaquinone-dependent protoporphyrinogen oxidase